MESTATSVEIRQFVDADYAAIVALHNANFSPELSRDLADVKFYDEHLPVHCRQDRWVAEVHGRVVGYGEYHQIPGFYNPRKFGLDVTIQPEFFGRGIGRQLYAQMIDALTPFEPESVDMWTREDMACRVKFLERRQFVPDMRLLVSSLDLTRFDPGRFAGIAERVESQGIQLRTLAELGPSDPAVWRKVHDAWSAIRVDIPQPPDEVRVDIPFEEYFARENGPNLLPTGFFVAVDGDTYVGVSELWRAPEPDVLRTGLTGVRRAYRRRGIAFGLKVRALEFALANGYRRVLTDNESNNRGMLGINQQLGFVKYPAWVRYLRSWAG